MLLTHALFPPISMHRARPDVALVKVLKGTREEAYEEALGHVLAALGLPPP